MGAPAAGGEDILVTIGEISCSRHYVYLPSGQFPLRGSTWTIRDQTRQEEKMPAYAIVLAIIFFLACLLGLLFLLIKQKTISGYVEVEVRGEGFYHVTQIPVSNAHQVPQLRQMVDYARSLAMSA
jgi:hypothetical protein